MRYFVNIGNGDDVYERELEFEDRVDGKWVKLYSHDAEGNETLELEKPIDVVILEKGRIMNLLLDLDSYDVTLGKRRDGFEISCRGNVVDVEVMDQRERLARLVAAEHPSGPEMVDASMPGIVASIEVELGQEVEAGTTLVVLEAMKMQNPITVERPGKVERILVKPGQNVGAGDALIQIV